MIVHVNGVGLIAPGLEGWEQGRAVLAGERPYQAEDLPAFKPALLPANERRRTTPLIKLALQVAEDALRGYTGDAAELASVFASAEGDAEVADKICRALLLPEHPVSPTQFHNSVHNAAAGYWAIASGSRRFSTSIAGGGDTFVVGLLEAAMLATQEQQEVMLVAYDYPLPPPLLGRGLVNVPFGMALILSAQARTAAGARLELSAGTQPCNTPGLPDGLAALRAGNPAAASLPLLRMLARSETGAVSLPYARGGSLRIEVGRC